MLTNKQMKNFGYTATIRKDTQEPGIIVMEPGTNATITGPTTIQIITGKATIKRRNNNPSNGHDYDGLETFETATIKPEQEANITTITGTVIIQHNKEEKITLQEVTETTPKLIDIEEHKTITEKKE